MTLIKNILRATILASAAMTAASCYIRISDEAKADLKKELTFNLEARKTVYTESDSLVYMPGSFTSLICSGPVDVAFVHTDCEPMVVVKGKHITRDSVKVINSGGELTISYSTPQAFDEHAVVFAPTPSRIQAVGSGDFQGSLGAGSICFRSYGSGDSNLTFTRTVGLQVDAAGSGDVTLKGEAETVTIDKKGSGDLNARELKAKSISVKHSGSGDVVYTDGNGKVVTEEG